jgi:hypothetical protein
MAAWPGGPSVARGLAEEHRNVARSTGKRPAIPTECGRWDAARGHGETYGKMMGHPLAKVC